MGYVRQRPVYRLVFDGDLEGLEVTVRSSSVLVYEDIAALADREFTSPPNAADRKAIADLYEAFAGVLVSWNLEEPADVPVPVTLAGVKTQDPAFVHTLITAWLDAVAEVIRGARPGEDDAAAAIEASLPMEPVPA